MLIGEMLLGAIGILVLLGILAEIGLLDDHNDPDDYV